MKAETQLRHEHRKARDSFWSWLICPLAAAAAIHVFADTLRGDRLLTFAAAMTFFVCLALSAWSLAGPLRAQLLASARWRYRDAPAPIRHAVETAALRLAEFTAGLAWIGVAACAVFALYVAAWWRPDLAAPGVRRGLQLAGMGLVLLIAFWPVAQLRLLTARRELLRTARDQIELSGFKPRTEAAAAAEDRAAAGPAVRVTGPMRFEAGGREWRWDDFYKNTAIFGQPGSGKTVCVLNALLEGLIASSGEGGKPAAGLILDPKGDFRDKIELLCARYGRAGDLLIIDPASPRRSVRWNPLDSDDDAMEIAGRFGAVMEILNPGGKDDAFFIQQAKTLVQNLIVLLRAARSDAPPSLPEVYRAAMAEPDRGDIRNSDTALDRLLDRIEHVDLLTGQAIDYLADDWLSLPENTRGSVRAFVSNMLGAFLSPPYDTVFSGRSTMRLGEMIDRGKILYVYMPVAEKEVMARVVSTFVKLEYYREVLRRLDKERPSFFLCDEFQSFFTVGQGKGDADAFAMTRQSNHANIIAFQNYAGLLKQTDRRENVDNLLSNCATKLFLRNTDKETNEYASQLFGEALETLATSSVSVSGGRRSGGPSSTVSGALQYGARVRKEAFAALAIPSREDGIMHAETMAHLGARAVVEGERLRWKVNPIK